MLQLITSGQRILMRVCITGDFSLGKFNVTLDCFCGRSVGMLIHGMWKIPTSRPLGTVLGSMWVSSNVIRLMSLPVKESEPYLIRSCLCPPESAFQMVSRLVQPFLQGSRSLQTDSVCSTRLRLANAAMGLIIKSSRSNLA